MQEFGAFLRLICIKHTLYARYKAFDSAFAISSSDAKIPGEGQAE
jgi:hypothetical protein